MEKVITVDISKSKFLRANPQWQYNHGQKLQFVGVELPPYYEVHFSNSINGEAKKQLGDSSGVLIPFEYFQPGKSIYVWIYITDSDSGITQRQVEIPIHKKAICTDEEPTPEQSDIIEEAIGALNSALDEVDDRIEAALDSAKQSGEFDGTDGTTIWTTSQAPSYPNYTFIIANLAGTPGAVPKEKDLIFYDLKYYKIINVGETSVLSSLYVDVKDNNVLHKTGDEMLGALSMGANKITNLANGTNNYDAVNLRQVKQMIADEGSTYRGSFNTKAALLTAPWQNVDRELPYYVDNKDFAIVQADESNNNECWRYMYTTGTGWGEQYKINDAPLSQAQIDALNSGITAVKVQKLDTVEPSAEVNIIEEIRVKNPITEQWAALPVTNKGVNLPEASIQKEVYYPTFTVDELGDELVVTSSSNTPSEIIGIAMLNEKVIIAKVSYNGNVFYLPLSEAQEDQALWACSFAGEIAEGIFLRIHNDELSWVVSLFTAAENEAVEIALGDLSDAIDDKYSKPSGGIPASDLANDVHFIPSGGTTGQVLKKSSNNDWDVDWTDDSGATIFDFIYDADNEVMVNFPTLDEVQEAGPGSVARLKFYGVSDEIYIPLADNAGVFYGVLSEDTIYSIYYANNTWLYAELPIGGGGGTSDYSDLMNKPQISSITLSGNKSLSDLGIEPEAFIVTITESSGNYSADQTYSNTRAAIVAGKRVVAVLDGCEYQLFSGTEIPYAIVFSANAGNKAYTITFLATDAITVSSMTLGTYSKPSGGIPKTDLTIAIQSSLDRADSALQSAPVMSVNGQTGTVNLSIPSIASDISAVAIAQGSAHAGEFVVVGSDGNITTVTMSAWQGGSY